MAITTTAALKVTDFVALTKGASGYTRGSWVEAIASCANETWLTGVYVRAPASYAGGQVQIDVGAGGAGAETVLGTVGAEIVNYGLTGPISFRVAYGPIAAGTRLALRVGGAASVRAGLAYTESLAADLDNKDDAPFAILPADANAVAITPNGTAWANSSWVEISASLAADTWIAGLRLGQNSNWGVTAHIEWDIGTGAAGAESVKTTVRSAYGYYSGSHFTVLLPALYGPVVSGTRVAVRMRKTGTNTNQGNVAMLIYTAIPSAAAAASGFPPLTVAL